MSLNSRMHEAVAVTALLGVMGCSEMAGPRTRPPDRPEVPRPALASARILPDSEAAVLIGRVATQLAARGDSAPLHTLRWLEEAARRPVAPMASEGAEYEASWGSPRIWAPKVQARLSSGGNYVFAGMSHDGHIGTVDLGFDLHHETRGSVMQMPPQRRYDFNPFGKYNLTTLSHTIEVLTPADCGHSLNAQGQFRSFYIGLPLPINVGPFTLPAAVSGVSGAGGYDWASQPSCGTGGTSGGGSPDEGDGSQGGGGYWLVYSECHGDDYYVNGVYVGSIVTRCSSYAVYQNAE